MYNLMGLKWRIISGIVLSGIIYATLYGLPFWSFGVFITVVIAIGLYEFFTMVQKKGIKI